MLYPSRRLQGGILKDFILVGELLEVNKTSLSFYFKGGYSGQEVKRITVLHNYNGFPFIVGRGYILHLRFRSICKMILTCKLLKVRAL